MSVIGRPSDSYSPRSSRKPVADRKLGAWNGYGVIGVLFVALLMSVSGLVSGNEAYVALGALGGGLIVLIGALLIWPGLVVLNPNHSLICLFFGRYVGTEHRSGLWWVNPFYTRRKISRRLHTLECGPLKVNDAIGNPIDIAAVIIWRVDDAAKAMLEVSSYDDYVKAQSEAALRRLASIHPYDNIEIEDSVLHGDTLPAKEAGQARSAITLRYGGEEISESLQAEIASRMRPIGVAVEEARISHLAYASEIAGTMLRRQAAGAVVAARRLVVKGAVSIVEEALKELDRSGISEGLDPERKAAMISNLLVVLVSDREVTPIINTGSLYT